jgi:ribosomal protein S18 acetylase RimI-like enzyme
LGCQTEAKAAHPANVTIGPYRFTVGLTADPKGESVLCKAWNTSNIQAVSTIMYDQGEFFALRPTLATLPFRKRFRGGYRKRGASEAACERGLKYMAVTVEVASMVDDDIVAAFAHLIPQLSSSNPPPDAAVLQAIVDHEACFLLLAKEDGKILGALTLVVFPIPTAIRAWIEDVVVDGDARGKGVGDLLSRAAVDIASANGAKTVELTSRPSREAANRLYQRIGFVARDTNVYRFTIDQAFRNV